MPSFKNSGHVPGEGKPAQGNSVPGKGSRAERLFDDGSPLAPPKEKNKIGIKGFGRDTSSKDAFSGSAFHRRDEVNPYAEQTRARSASDKRKTMVAVMAILLIVFLGLSMVLPYGLLDNPRGVSLAGVVASTQRNVHDFIALFVAPDSAGSAEARAARYLCIVMAGAALGVVGAVYQGSLRNALASPSTLGVDTGSICGAAIFLLVFGGANVSLPSGALSNIRATVENMSLPELAWVWYGKAICAMIGAFTLVAVVVLITVIAGRGRFSGTWLIVTGTIVATMFGSGMTLISQWFIENNMAAQEEALNSISSSAFTGIHAFGDVLVVGVPVITCMAIILAIRIKLGLLTFGDDEARSMGINPVRLRVFAIAITTIMSAIIVAFCGSIGFLGFMIPHITRRFIGSDFRYLLPASALSGALVLITCYYFMSLWSAQAANYVGVLTSIIGFAVFAVMFVKQKGFGRNAQTNTTR